jgi:thimet oligopeptidase
MEEWSWDQGVLDLFARDDQGKTIPPELVKKMRAAEDFGKGTWVRNQMFYAALSLATHLADPATIDTTKMVIDLQKKYAMIPYTEGTHFQAAFGHLNGYSSGYYTYMWSMVIAKDMFSAFQKAGLMNETVSHKYRDTVLVPGGSKDAAQLVKDFLGRPYGFASFKKWLDK